MVKTPFSSVAAYTIGIQNFVDVAVKLAKKYGDVTDYKFVNGILDNCLNDNLRK